jgi:hypothetical protein
MDPRVEPSGRVAPRRRRVWLAAGTVGLSTLGIVLAIAGLPSLLGPRGQAVGFAPTASPTQPTAESTTALTPEPTHVASNRPVVEKSSAATKRLTTQLRAALSRVKPDATTRGIRGVYALRQLGAFEVIGSQGGYKAWAEIKDSQGPGTMFVVLDPTDPVDFGSRFPAICETPFNVGFTCRIRTDDATGARIIVEQGQHPGERVSYNIVTVVKRDGTSLWVMLSNFSENDQPQTGKSNPNPQRTEPPLNPDQIVDLLLSGGLTLYP